MERVELFIDSDAVLIDLVEGQQAGLRISVCDLDNVATATHFGHGLTVESWVAERSLMVSMVVLLSVSVAITGLRVRVMRARRS